MPVERYMVRHSVRKHDHTCRLLRRPLRADLLGIALASLLLFSDNGATSRLGNAIWYITSTSRCGNSSH